MKIIFAGTPDFAAVALAALLKSNHDVIAVYTQPDRPAGRGLKLTASPVKLLAEQYKIPVYQPASLKNDAAQQQLAALGADAMVVAAYGLILPQAVLDAPRLGCVNIHPSLLPRWRGAAPIQRAIFAGDQETGVSIMKMDAGLDTGPVYLQQHYTLSATETSASLHDQLAVISAGALIETLNKLEAGTIEAVPQNDELVTYADKITKDEALIDWQATAHDIDCKIRAFNPWPMAYTHLNSERLRVGASVLKHSDTYFVKRNDDKAIQPGSIFAASSDGIDVITGDHKLVTLLSMQLPGGKMLAVKDFYNSRKDKLQSGTVLS